MGCFSGHLMSAASDHKLFCELCSAFNCSFDKFVGEKVVSPSYSSAILAPPPTPVFLSHKVKNDKTNIKSNNHHKISQVTFLHKVTDFCKGLNKVKCITKPCELCYQREPRQKNNPFVNDLLCGDSRG